MVRPLSSRFTSGDLCNSKLIYSAPAISVLIVQKLPKGLLKLTHPIFQANSSLTLPTIHPAEIPVNSFFTWGGEV